MFPARHAGIVDLDCAFQRLQLPDRDDPQSVAAGLKIVEIPIIFTDRFQGTSKMSPKIVREALRITWKMLFQNRLSALRPAAPGRLRR